MDTSALVAALRDREQVYSEAVSRALEPLDRDPEAYETVRRLRDAVELVRCLRRLVPACSLQELHKAFGAPGDWGYETPIGDALSRLYRGES